MIKKRIMALLLSFLMGMQCLPVSALADGGIVLLSGTEGTDYYTVEFVVEGETISTQYVRPGSDNVAVPADPVRPGKTFLG